MMLTKAFRRRCGSAALWAVKSASIATHCTDGFGSPFDAKLGRPPSLNCDLASSASVPFRTNLLIFCGINDSSNVAAAAVPLRPLKTNFSLVPAHEGCFSRLSIGDRASGTLDFTNTKTTAAREGSIHHRHPILSSAGGGARCHRHKGRQLFLPTPSSSSTFSASRSLRGFSSTTRVLSNENPPPPPGNPSGGGGGFDGGGGGGGGRDVHDFRNYPYGNLNLAEVNSINNTGGGGKPPGLPPNPAAAAMRERKPAQYNLYPLVGPVTMTRSANQHHHPHHSNGFGAADDIEPAARPEIQQPNRIILIRHGEALGTVDERAYVDAPDWCLPLTQQGYDSAIVAGKNLAKLLQGSGAFFYVSPYKRTMQTLHCILQALTPNQMEGMRVEPRLSEQQFGNFQNYEAMIRCKKERRVFGRFYYRFPNGESGLDVYNRVDSLVSTMKRDSSFRKGTNIVMVTHGLLMRLFLMRWYQWSVQRFERTNNPFPCGRVVMEAAEEVTSGGLHHYDLVEDAQILAPITDNRRLWTSEPWPIQYIDGKWMILTPLDHLSF